MTHPILRGLAWGYHRLIDAMALVSALSVLVMLVMVSGDVISRQTGFGSWRSTIPVVQVALLYFTVMAAPWLVRERAHVAVDSFVGILPKRLARVILWGVFALSVAAAGVASVTSVIVLEEAISTGEQIIGGIIIPFWLLVAPLPLGYALVATEFARLALTGGSPYGDGVEGL